MRSFLRKYLNRYALFDTLIIAAAIAFGVFTGKIVYESRCQETVALLDRLLVTSEAALAAVERVDSATLDTLSALPAPPAPVPPTEVDDR